MSRLTRSTFARVVAGLAVLALACNDNPSDPTGPQPTPIEVAVDETLELPRVIIPGLDGAADRPLAGITDASGHVTLFVENELWVTDVSRDDAEAFAERWDGEITNEVDLTDIGGSTHFLIRVNVADADASTLSEDLSALSEAESGNLTVSSDVARNLLAVSASEHRSGTMVGVNWVGGSTSFLDRTTTEAPVGPSGYSPNAYNWNHLNDIAPGTNVTEAWRLLALTDRLKNRVKIAILDQGFSSDEQDTGADFVVGPIPAVNFVDIAGYDIPWHGNNVASAAAALVDDGHGGAGVAGPIASLQPFFTSYDYFTSIFVLWVANLMDMKIANMSYSARVPAGVSWTVLPFNIATLDFRGDGMLLFASAGNDGENVDDEDCVLVCWEEAWITPCENGGVICVGGTAAGRISLAAGSNHGAEDVDIYAPFTVWVGPDPDVPGNITQMISGTSFSAPFVAGTAALIWAANPSFSADDVENCLLESASVGQHPVSRIVNAEAAVVCALGTVAPRVEILSPEDESSFSSGGTITFTCEVEDYDGDDFPPRWESVGEGAPFGTGTVTSTHLLTTGIHEIRCTVEDAAGNIATDSILISVLNDPPTMNIVTPTSGQRYFESQEVTLSGAGIDPTDLTKLPPSALTWKVDGAVVGTGTSHTISGGTLSTGSHNVEFLGVDSEGAEGRSTVTFFVDEDPLDVPPSVRIISPLPESTIDAGGDRLVVVAFQGEGTDVEDGPLTGDSLTWHVESTDGTITHDGTGQVWAVEMTSGESGMAYEVTLTATDSGGNETSTSMFIIISTIF